MKLSSDVLAIATADLHIDDHNWADRAEIFGDSRWSLQWIVDLAVENDLPIIAAGDILDKPVNDASPIGFVREQVNRVKRGFYYTQGQKTHDQQDGKPWLSAVSDNVTWLDEYCREPGSGLRLGEDYGLIWGLDWTPPEQLPAELARIPSHVEIGVFHQVCGDLMGSIRVPEIYVAAIPHVHIAIMGDYHRHVAKKLVGASGQELHLLSPGATNMREISEPGDKYIFLLHRDLSYSSLRIPTRPVLRMDIAAEMMLDEFVKTIDQQLVQVASEPWVQSMPEHIQKPIIQVRFNPDIPEAYSRIRLAIGDSGHLFTKTHVPGERMVIPTNELTEAEEVVELSPDEDLTKSLSVEGAVACLPDLVDAEAEPEVFNLCRGLLTEQNPAAVIAAARAKFIEV